MSTELGITGAIFQGATQSASPTIVSTSQTDSTLSSDTEKIGSNNDDLVEMCRTPLPEYEPGCQQNADTDRSKFYCVTLVVSTEQETAIIDLFREKQWIYRKLDCEDYSPRSCNVQTNVSASNNRENCLGLLGLDERPYPLFLEKNKTHGMGTDTSNQFPSTRMRLSTDINVDSNIDRYMKKETEPRKGAAAIGENLKDLTAFDLDKDNSINDFKYNYRKKKHSKTNARKSTLHNKETLQSNTILSHDYESGIYDSDSLTEHTEEFQQEPYIETLKTVVETESTSDCPRIIIKVEPDSKELDNASFDDTSFRSDKCLSPIQKLSMPRNKSSNIPKDIYCKDCEHTFKKRFFYEKHLKEGRCKRTCKYCGKEFLYKGGWRYMIHMRYHNKQKDQECKICGKLFIEKSKMIQHVKSHANPKPKVCEKCGKRYPTTTSLTLHMANMHTEKRDMLQCEKCEKLYTNKSSLQYHMRSAHESSIFFPCLTCNKTFKHKRLLTLHELTHKDTKDFKCDKCAASFKRPSGLLSHQKRHEKAFKFFCSICNRGFYAKRQLHQHENIHTGLKPFGCSLCDYRCAFQGNLSKHMKIHKGLNTPML